MYPFSLSPLDNPHIILHNVYYMDFTMAPHHALEAARIAVIDILN